VAVVVATAAGPGLVPDPGRFSDVDVLNPEDAMEEAIQSVMLLAPEPFLQLEKPFTTVSDLNPAHDVTAPGACPARTATFPRAIDVGAAAAEVWMTNRRPPELTLIVE